MTDTQKVEAIFFDLGDTLVSKDRMWIPGARELLSDLQSLGIGIGLISNTGTLSRDQLCDLLPADFDFGAFRQELVLLSSEVGIEKPDVRIFQEAHRRAGVSAQACLFCTEDLSHTLAAQRASLRAARAGAPDGLADLIPALRVAGFL